MATIMPATMPARAPGPDHPPLRTVNPGMPPGIPTPPNPGEMPPPNLPPPPEDPDTGPTGPRVPGPDPDVDEPPDPAQVPDRLPGIPTGPGTRHAAPHASA